MSSIREQRGNSVGESIVCGRIVLFAIIGAVSGCMHVELNGPPLMPAAINGANAINNNNKLTYVKYENACKMRR